VEKASSDPETQFAMLYSHGLVHWWTPIEQSTAHCPMDITWFPLDTQYCPLIYESWAMPSSQLNISLVEPAVDFDYYQKSGEWQLLGIVTVYFCLYYEQYINLILHHLPLFYLFVSFVVRYGDKCKTSFRFICS